MIALIAEKPSVAKDIARIIGATGRNDGYLSGNGTFGTYWMKHLGVTDVAAEATPN